jgi:hypothetical protein
LIGLTPIITFEPIKVKALLIRITLTTYFELALVLLNNEMRIPKISNVGIPLGLNEARAAPGINIRKKWLLILSGCFVQAMKKATISRRPDVNGMSCHSVIPIPATTGVKVNKNEAIAAEVSLKMA